MKFSSIIYSPRFRMLTLLSALQCVVLIAACPVGADQVPRWNVNTLKQTGWNDRSERGLLMFTTGSDESGAAFHCYLGEMHVYLLNQPSDVRKQVTDKKRRGSTFELSYRINSSEEKTTHWRRSEGGTIFQVLGTSSIMGVFQASTDGATIYVTNKLGESLTFSIPRAGPQLVDAFLDSCNLKKKYRSDLIKAS